MSRTCLALAAGLAIGASAAAHPSRARHHVRVAPPPSADAIDLGALAPPSGLSTLTQSYGDAAIARAHLQGIEGREARAAIPAPPPYPCDPRQAGTSGYVCANPPGRLGYGQFYAFTPSYVSAPQVVGVEPGAESPILPPATALLWVVNGLRFDPHD